MTNPEKSENIFIFIPNLIGYGRIILALISFYYMPTNYVVAGWCYIISALADAFDGAAARRFNQSTKFGAILDQLTDRCGTMGLLVVLSNFYPQYIFWFQLSMAIDVFCHWIHVHASLLQGKTSHKFIDLSENPIMRIYYTNKNVLFLMCLTNEFYFSSLYLLHFTSGPLGIFRLTCYITFPFMLVKTFISLLQAYVACKNIAVIDVQERAQLRREE